MRDADLPPGKRGHALSVRMEQLRRLRRAHRDLQRAHVLTRHAYQKLAGDHERLQHAWHKDYRELRELRQAASRDTPGARADLAATGWPWGKALLSVSVGLAIGWVVIARVLSR